MEELINVCVNNGLGVASFIALILFIFKYQSKISDTLEEINKSQASIQTTLTALTTRIDNIENKIDKEG
jgi:uncharacterized protein YoxC